MTIKSESDFDWIIIGGGPHGIHFASRLLEAHKPAAPKIAIIDPWPRLLHQWDQLTLATGMQYLRSPAVHNLGVDPFDLQKFAGKKARYKSLIFRQPYSRPYTRFFKKHCEAVLEDYALQNLHIKSRVLHCKPGPERVELETCSRELLTSSKVLIATGAGDNLNFPDWYQPSPNIQHIFSETFTWPDSDTNKNLVVVGGGISAIHASLYAVKKGFQVHLISRHSIRTHQFDSDPGWLGPKNMSRFLGEKSYESRRTIIDNSRHRGSAPAELVAQLRSNILKNNVIFCENEITNLTFSPQKTELGLKDGRKIFADQVILATGFCKHRPGGRLIDELVDKHNLPVASCNYPVLDTRLRWHPRLYVSGPLAELEIGPTARNLSGARSAARRIIGY